VLWAKGDYTRLCCDLALACLAGSHNAASHVQHRKTSMTMKKTDLAKNLALQIEGRRKAAGVPARFAQGADLPDRRAQRRLDSAAGLLPFACKLPADLARSMHERALGYEGGVNALVAALLRQALASNESL